MNKELASFSKSNFSVKGYQVNSILKAAENYTKNYEDDLTAYALHWEKTFRNELDKVKDVLF